MAKTQSYNIQFPFVNDKETGALFKLASTEMERVKSDIRHVIFTPKGQRYMDPGFGTDLIPYIFDQNESLTWDNVRTEISQTVKKYVPGVTIRDIQVYTDQENMNDTYIKVAFSMNDGTYTVSDSFISKI